jgi:hypothetical protein
MRVGSDRRDIRRGYAGGVTGWAAKDGDSDLGRPNAGVIPLAHTPGMAATGTLAIAGILLLVFGGPLNYTTHDSLNRTDSGGGSIVWRTMESWQSSATIASGGIHRN